MEDFSDVTRVEVIDHTKTVEEGGGRVYSNWNVAKVEVMLQDNARTLKVFVE